MTEQAKVLPKTWKELRLLELAQLVRGVSYKKEDAVEEPRVGYIALLRATNITGHDLLMDDFVYVPDKYVNDEQLLRQGDIVIASSSGSKEVVGKAGQFFKDEGSSYSFGAFCTTIRPSTLLDQSYLGYYFQTAQYRRAVSDLAAGSNINNLKRSHLSELRIPIAPLPEQYRIVERLEELLSDLDTGVTELKAAQMKLARYGQSLLKAAVEGALTVEWREKQRKACTERSERMETGAQLLERILAERRRRWTEKQLAKFNAQGKTPPKDWQRKYSEPIAPDTASLTELPEGWAWATIDQLALEQRYGSSAKTSANQSGVPVLRMGNIQDGTLDLGNLKYLPLEHNEFPNLILQDGDLLFNRTNSPELVGKSAVYRSQIAPCSYASYLIAVRFSPMFVPELAAMYINSGFGKRWIKSVVSQQVGQANVNGTKLAALAIPLPPHQEQIEILRMTNELLAGAHVQDAEIEFGLKQTSAQRKNILKAAFSGKLVPQDPNDEPASILLERARSARSKRQPNAKNRSTCTKEMA